jgi:uncharacterized protein YkwD
MKIVSRVAALAACMSCATQFSLVPLAAGAGSEQQTIRAVSQAFGPRNTVRFSRPTLLWRVWSASSQVTHVEMIIDSLPVSAKYDVDSRSIIYTPDTALAVGAHHVVCRATFDGKATFTKLWDMTVASDAVDTLPPPTSLQKQFLALANAKRRALGLPEMTLDDRLDAAANAHVAYLVANKLSGHDESPDAPAFIGRTGSERCESFGWCMGSWEGISVGEASASDAVEDLFDAPYHRVPFLQPGPAQFGAASTESKSTLVFGTTNAQGIVMSPGDGQSDVPVRWENHEEPSPLRGHTSESTAGYPLVIAAFGEEPAKIQVSEVSLATVGGQTVDTWLQTPDNDEFLTDAAFVIPIKPLSPGTTYIATARITYGDKSLTKTWKFRTREAL